VKPFAAAECRQATIRSAYVDILPGTLVFCVEA
jgi:hypothetical protein